MIQEEIGDTAVEIMNVFFNNALIPSIVTLFVIMLAVYYLTGKAKFKQSGIELALIMLPVLVGLYTALFYFSPELREMLNFRLLSFWQDEGVPMAGLTAPVLGLAVIIMLGAIILILSVLMLQPKKPGSSPIRWTSLLLLRHFIGSTVRKLK